MFAPKSIILESVHDLLASGQHLDRLIYIVAGKEHSAQETSHKRLCRLFRILAEPLNQIEITTVEESVVVQREVRLARRRAPFISTFVRFHLSGDNLKESRVRQFVFSDESDFIIFIYPEGNIIENLHAVDGLAEIFHGQQFLARLSVHGEAHVRIPAGRSRHLFYGELIQKLSSRSGLLRFGLICGEPLDKRLQFFDLVFFPRRRHRRPCGRSFRSPRPRYWCIPCSRNVCHGKRR